jgi:RNA polymerase sigma-70 factor, ECF subfamily
MNRSERSDQVNLANSKDEIMLSALMRKSLDGDSESYRLLLQKVKDLMTPFVSNTLSKFGLSASGGQEDVLQEILLGLHLKRATFDPSQFFLPWMYAIARYKAIDYLRRNKVAFKSVSIEESFEEFELGEVPEVGTGLDLESLCERLPQKQRDLLLLVKVDGLSINEAALKTGFSVSDVKVTVHRALKELKKQVKDAGHDN